MMRVKNGMLVTLPMYMNLDGTRYFVKHEKEGRAPSRVGRSSVKYQGTNI